MLPPHLPLNPKKASAKTVRPAGKAAVSGAGHKPPATRGSVRGGTVVLRGPLRVIGQG